MNSPAPGWLPDPTSRHEYRYWDGSRWTDDVADGGVASTDALVGGPADQNPTASDTTQQVDPTRQYPVAGQQTPTSAPYYDDYGTGQAPAAPARKRPPAGLIAALAVLAVALIGGLVYVLVRDDDDGSSDNGSDDNASEVSDEGTTTTDGENQEGGDNGSSGGSDGGADTTLPGDVDSENVDQLVELMADNMEQASGGVLDHEEATCISRGMLDELGVERLADVGAADDPFADPEIASQLFGIMEDCGVSLSDLADLPD